MKIFKKSLLFMFFLSLFSIFSFVSAQNHFFKQDSDLSFPDQNTDSDFDWTQWLELVDGTVFKVPLDKYDIKTFVWNPVTTTQQWVRNLWWEWGINWSFFCPAEKSYAWCGGDNSTVSERFIDWKDLSRYDQDTGVRWVFWFDKEGIPLFVQKNRWYVEWYARNTNEDKIWEIYEWIWNRPILLDEWYDPLMFYGDQIKYAKNLKKMSRNFICSTKDWNTIYMWFVRDKTIFEMPNYLEAQYWCFFALNLDAWYSSAMVYHDQHLVWPGRDVVDGFVAVPKDFWLAQQLENYELNKEERLQVLLFYKIFKKKVEEKWKDFQKTLLTALSVFDKKKSIRWNIPLRVQFRVLRWLLEKL